MANQYIALFEHTVRDTITGSEAKMFLPVMDNLQPTFEPDDQPRKEFRGQDSALGDISEVRRSSQWTYSLKCAAYPIDAVGFLLKHLLGKSVTRSAVDVSAYEGIIYPLADPYSAGELVDKAIGLVINTDEEGTTKSRTFYGGRIKSLNLHIEGTDDVILTFEIQGPGDFIGAEGALLAGASFTSVSPFVSSDALLYIGTGISRTGSAPDFTAIAKGTMDAFKPDSIDVTITNGLGDKTVLDGVQGPSWTTREAQFMVEVAAPIDYSDPSSGFSSADEYKLIFDGPVTNSMLVVLDNGEAAGDTTTNYSWVIDLAALLVKPGTPSRNTDGITPTIEFSYNSKYDETAEYPIAFFTTDKESAY